MNKKIIGFLALVGGLGVFAEIFLHLSKLPLDLIGAGLAVLAGLIGLFDRGI